MPLAGAVMTGGYLQCCVSPFLSKNPIVGFVTRIVRATELRPRIDLLADTRYLWQGSRKYVELDPQVMPGHVFHVRRRVQTEKDFDYFM